HPPEAEVAPFPDERLLRKRRLSQRTRGPVPLVIEVAAALIRDTAGRYLITQRRRGSHLEGLWEFPGGKQEVGEAPEACLKREMAEELSASLPGRGKVTTMRL